MLKKLYLPILFSFTLIVLQTYSQVVNGTPEMIGRKLIDIDYTGPMDVEMRNGKKYEGRKATFIINNNKLLCDMPKIGKMPGKISIELPLIFINDSIFTADKESIAGTMKMPMGMKFKLRLDTLYDTKIIDNKLSFKMTVYGQFMGTIYPTSISFEGKH